MLLRFGITKSQHRKHRKSKMTLQISRISIWIFSWGTGERFFSPGSEKEERNRNFCGSTCPIRGLVSVLYRI